MFISCNYILTNTLTHYIWSGLWWRKSLRWSLSHPSFSLSLSFTLSIVCVCGCFHACVWVLPCVHECVAHARFAICKPDWVFGRISLSAKVSTPGHSGLCVPARRGVDIGRHNSSLFAFSTRTENLYLLDLSCLGALHQRVCVCVCVCGCGCGCGCGGGCGNGLGVWLDGGLTNNGYLATR